MPEAFNEWAENKRKYYTELEIKMKEKGMNNDDHFGWVQGHRCAFEEVITKLKELNA